MIDGHWHTFPLTIITHHRRMQTVVEQRPQEVPIHERPGRTLMTGGLMTVEETCQYLKVSHRTLSRYLRNYQLPAFTLEFYAGEEWQFVRLDRGR
ncbi:MAG: helix-turn-helix domain-containing protein [Nitrospira sp.]|nr:helix-turn-helix domain-containing protein [Nitrospira sp.]